MMPLSLPCIYSFIVFSFINHRPLRRMRTTTTGWMDGQTTFICAVAGSRNVTVISARKQSAAVCSSVCQYGCWCCQRLPDARVIYSHICRHIKPTQRHPRPPTAEKVRRHQACRGRSPSDRHCFRTGRRQFPARIWLNFEPAACVIASMSAAAAAAAAARCVNSPTHRKMHMNNNNYYYNYNNNNNYCYYYCYYLT